MTDSMLVIQAIEDYANITCHPHTVHELVHLWRQLCRYGKAVHAGHAQNTLTDRAATESLKCKDFRRVHRTVNYSKVFITNDHQSIPRFRGGQDAKQIISPFSLE